MEDEAEFEDPLAVDDPEPDPDPDPEAEPEAVEDDFELDCADEVCGAPEPEAAELALGVPLAEAEDDLVEFADEELDAAEPLDPLADEEVEDDFEPDALLLALLDAAEEDPDLLDEEVGLDPPADDEPEEALLVLTELVLEFVDACEEDLFVDPFVLEEGIATELDPLFVALFDPLVDLLEQLFSRLLEAEPAIDAPDFFDFDDMDLEALFDFSETALPKPPPVLFVFFF